MVNSWVGTADFKKLGFDLSITGYFDPCTHELEILCFSSGFSLGPQYFMAFMAEQGTYEPFLDDEPSSGWYSFGSAHFSLFPWGGLSGFASIDDNWGITTSSGETVIPIQKWVRFSGQVVKVESTDKEDDLEWPREDVFPPSSKPR